MAVHPGVARTSATVFPARSNSPSEQPLSPAQLLHAGPGHARMPAQTVSSRRGIELLPPCARDVRTAAA